MLNDHQNTNLPLVSIIIPCFNSENYIAECLNSVLAQDYKNLEVIVVDDGSQDDSLNIIKSYTNIQLYTQKNSGACVARNLGLSKSRGKYIKFLDSDDFLEPSIIKKQVDLAEQLDEDRIVYGDYYLFRNYQKNYENVYLEEANQTALLILGDILTSTPLHRKWMLDKVKGFDERFKNGQEWNLHVRLSSEGFIFHHQKLAIYNYRIHQDPNRISVKKSNDTNRQLYEALKLEMTQERLGSSYRGDINFAFAKKYWIIARTLYRLGDKNTSLKYLRIAQQLTTEYDKFFGRKYNLVYKLLGFSKTEQLFKAYSFFKKVDSSKYV